MASTRDIRRRIKSVKNTAQITKAMQMVAAAKMRKAQQAALVGRPYAKLLNVMMAEAATGTVGFDHPLMQTRPVGKRAVILVSSDRGLCGGLNSNIFREASKLDKNTTVFVTAGKKAAQFIARTKRTLAGEFSYKDTPEFAEARAISKFVQQMFLKGEVDAVDILYPRFVNTLTQQPSLVPFLPIGKLAAVTAGLIAWFGWRGWEKYVGHATIPLRIGAVFVPAGIAGTFYILTALKLKIPAAHELLAFAGKRFKKT